MSSRTVTRAAAGATALAALLTLTACGGDDDAVGSGIAAIGGLEGGNGNSGDGGNAKKGNGLGFKGLPKAGSMAEAARIVNGYTKCDRISSTKSDSSTSGSDPDAKYDSKTYSVTERGYCGRRNVTTIFMIKDPKVFQAAFRAEVEKDHADGKNGDVNSGPIIGQDFAVGSESSDAMAALLAPGSGMLLLNCHPGFNPPSGFRKEPSLVKGCVLTDYYKD
ncbi:hypothetical protein HYE82_33415 [Streptomyces sp. BR123]|uniref:hypothetical protein n=1 Tax=Streptomyces sp. BR123 TaxID=2749828 RepID=UPI0015C4D3AE|nr:hypothetical protein [Streptomyces sp. BR123]NXY99195.1 hypothetical protein [Streptomyces sp. BR123]